MESKRLIVIGASAGGFACLKTLAAGLPADFPAPILVVWHIPSGAKGILPEMLSRCGPLPALTATDGASLAPGRIYIAPADHHLLVDGDRMLVSRGPKENRFRPAIDPLFRSAAFSHRSKVIGIILSGLLSDGASGLWSVKHFGGVAIVQDPLDAEFPAMPVNASRNVAVDHTLPVANMPALLARLVREPAAESPAPATMIPDEQTSFEIRTAAGTGPAMEIKAYGRLTPYTCPECHGVLFSLQDDARQRFRCHTGHAFSMESLLENVTNQIEETIWTVIRSVDEAVMLLTQMAAFHTARDESEIAARYSADAEKAAARIAPLRALIGGDSALQPHPNA